MSYYPKSRKILNLMYKYHTNSSGAHWRTTRIWYKPIQFLGEKAKQLLYKIGLPVYHRYIWWIRKNITNQ